MAISGFDLCVISPLPTCFSVKVGKASSYTADYVLGKIFPIPLSGLCSQWGFTLGSASYRWTFAVKKTIHLLSPVLIVYQRIGPKDLRLFVKR